jgi:hypothetical protein
MLESDMSSIADPDASVHHSKPSFSKNGPNLIAPFKSVAVERHWAFHGRLFNRCALVQTLLLLKRRQGLRVVMFLKVRMRVWSMVNVVRLVLMVPVNVLERLVVEGWMLLLMLMVLLLWG